ncbi:unnamed protein product [Peronospora belbahrii]|uniref:Uncharacterized protein n=1 Tax=Peronospora belbahrii TaxID=622444 RepID=A0AAU9KU10_9STRA|nr:unnamed protein product [Peronospora belbahrii]CAH0476025.1 unnamed protein product [Peronospora belbahrii]
MDNGDKTLLATKKKVFSSLDNKPVLLTRAPVPLSEEFEPEDSPCSPTFVFPRTISNFNQKTTVVISAQVPEVQDDVSAARMVAVVLDYLRDVAHYCNCAVSWSFAQLRQTLQSIPFAVGQMQTIVKIRLGLSWPLVTAFVQNVTDFISDEDIRDASVGELVVFLQTWQVAACEQAVVAGSSNICANLVQFFRDVLEQFKQFLTKRWLQSGRISFPCEFGKKSDSLFLCMECHREHM